VLLHNHARHRVRAGQNFELILADEAAVAGQEISQAFERVSQRVIAEQLCELDSSLGLNVTQLVVTKFRLLPANEEDHDYSLLNVSAPDVMQDRPPLSLAAHAAANGVNVFDVEEFHVVDPGEDVIDHESPTNGSLNPSNQATETAV